MSFIDRADITIDVLNKARRANFNARHEGINLNALKGLDLPSVEEFVASQDAPAIAETLNHGKVLASVRQDAYAGAGESHITAKAAEVKYANVEMDRQDPFFDADIVFGSDETKKH